VRRARAALGVLLMVSWQPAYAMGPFEKNDPRVQDGMSSYDKGDYDGALKKFDEAKKELPGSAAVEFDRANTLYKLGRPEEARDAYHQVADLDKGELRAKDYYNLGDAWAQLGNDKEAIAAFRKALTLDPNDAQARHNLEVMLRKLPPPKGGSDGGTDGGSPDGGSSDGGRDGGRSADAGQDGGSDGGQDGGADGGRGPDGGSGDGGRGDGGSGQGHNKAGDGGEPQPNPARSGGDGGQGQDAGEQDEPQRRALDAGVEMGRLSKQEAERLLDSMKRDEKNLQLWRFQTRKPRKTTDKDW
jgi:tetratricopeptide (TPR) repeat protein